MVKTDSLEHDQQLLWQPNGPVEQKTILPNGIRVVSVPVTGVRTASLIISFTVGSRLESDEVAGISHFLEHMLFKGTERRPDPLTFSEEIEGVGGWLNAGTTKESTYYTCKVPSEYAELAFDILSDMICNSRFDIDGFEIERKVIIEEVRSIQDSPSNISYELMTETVWDGHPLGRSIVGFEETVQGMQRDTVVDYYHRNYTPDRMVIAAGGDVRHDDIVDWVSRYFGDFTATGCPDSARPVNTTQNKKRVRILNKDTEQAHLRIAYPSVSYLDEPRFIHMGMMDWILSGGMSSRLFREIREKRGIVYSISSSYSGYRDVGLGSVSAAVDLARIDEAVEAIMEELRKLRGVPVPEDELARTKRMWRGSINMSLESSYSITSSLSDNEERFGRLRTVDEALSMVDAVTDDNIRSIATELLQEDHLSLVLVGPFEDEDQFHRLLSM